MKKDGIKDISNVRKSGRGRYEVRWIDADGKDLSFSSTQKNKVEKKRAELIKKISHGSVATRALLDIDFDGTSQSYSALLDQAARCLVTATVNGDDIAIDRLKKFSEALKSIAGSVLPFKKYEELEDEMEALLKYHHEVARSAEKEGIAQLQSTDTSIDQTLAGNTGSCEKICQPCDPIPISGRG